MPTTKRSHRRFATRGRGSLALAAAAVLASLLGAAIVARATPAAADPVGTVSNFGTAIMNPYAITAGPDGNLWYTNADSNMIGRISTTGQITNFTGDRVTQPYGITTGPDGNLWFTNAGNNSIGRLTPYGVFTFFDSPTIKYPIGITAGPDGNLWFTNESGASIGRITPGGAVTAFTAAGVAHPTAITAGPDGNLWFTNTGTYPSYGDSAIGRVTPAGAVTLFPNAGVKAPPAISTGPDGNLWFTNPSADTIGRVTPGGAYTFFADPSIDAPGGITAGPDGALWFTGTGAIGRISPAGAISTHPAAGGTRIAAGADGNLWYTVYPGSIGRMTTGGVETLFTGTPTTGPLGIANGPDGALWFSNNLSHSIGRITPAGDVSYFTDPTIGSAYAITAGADGNLWFSNGGSPQGPAIGRITPAGVVSNFPDPALTGPGDLVAGPDGNVWFTNSPNGIGRITPAGVVTVFTSNTVDKPQGLAVGPDGNLWFTNRGSIGRVTPTGTFSAFTGPAIKGPQDITAGADGNLWYTNYGSSIGRITPAGVALELTGTGLGFPSHIAAGPDGNVWFTNANNSIGRITPTGVVTNHRGPGISNPIDITAGPDGGMWFANYGNSSIGRITAVDTPPDPSAGTTFHPLAPLRVLDSRTSTGGWNTPLVAGAPRSLVVAGGSLPVPAGARAVVLNITVTGSSDAAFLTAYPTGSQRPTASNVNFAKGQTTANAATVTVGDGGRITLATSAGAVDVVADLAGYFDGAHGDRYTPLTPTRVLDSRTGSGAWSTPLPAGTTRPAQIAGAHGVPATADAVILNVTVTGGTANSFLTVHPAGSLPPTASSVNFAAGQTIPNMVVVKVGVNGQIAFENHVGAVDVVVDLAGYFDASTGDLFHPLAPHRVLDSRTTVGGWSGPLDAATPRQFAMVPADGVPNTASAVLANTTVTQSTENSFLTVHPAGSPATTSSLNFAAGETIPNMVAVKIGTDHQIQFETARGHVDVVFDLAGYFAPT
jgi:streptogramin lyase